MAGDWEVRGLFGSEFALDHAVEEIQKMQRPPTFEKLDRRNLQVVLSKGDPETKKLVRNIITIAHGFIESDAPLGTLEKKKAEIKAQRLKKDAEKKKLKAKRTKH
jgi:hypothetical protein